MVQGPARAKPERKVVPFSTSDASIVQGLLSNEPWAADALYERYSGAVERMLRRTLGQERHADLEDLLHDVFLEAIVSAEKLRDPTALLAWLQRIAVHTAFRAMRRRRARNWLRFREPAEVPEVPTQGASQEIRQACKALYTVLGRMPASEQIVFTLRYLEGMELLQLAHVCDVSLSTAKRRLAKAEARFATLAAREPSLSEWLEEGAPWAR